MSDRSTVRAGGGVPLRLVVIWIDWYAYHVARFRGLMDTPALAGRVRGVELVGGVGVHQGLRFREELPAELPVDTLEPEASWATTSQRGLARQLWRRLDALDPEAVLVPGYYTLPAIAAAVWARVHDRRSLLMTESTARDHARTGWKEAAKGWLLRLLFDGAVTGGSAHRRYLAELGFPMDRVTGCYDVVDNAGIATGVRELRRDRRPEEFGLPSAPYFLYVGRLAPEKNVGTLVEAWAAYRADGGKWGLVLGGDGPEAARMRGMPGAQEVHFAGHLSARALMPLYAFAGCFVLPSNREPWGLVVNEAMAAGLPVLVSDRCGSAEDLVSEGGNGFVFSPDDPVCLQTLLARMSTLSEEELRAMGEQSACRIGAYNPQQFGESIALLLAAD